MPRQRPAPIPAEVIEAVNLHQQGRLPEAERLYRQALVSSPGNFYALHQFAMLRLDRGDHVEALQLMSAAVSARPDSAEALANYGLILQALQRSEEAIEHYDRALALKPDHVPALFNRGNALFSLGHYERALAGYEATLARDPNHLGALFNRGNTLRELGRRNEAIAGYARLLALKPDHAEAREAYARSLEERDGDLRALGRTERMQRAADTIAHGDEHFDAGRFPEAIASYDEALRLAPADFHAANNRGLALMRLGRLDEALDAFDKAAVIRPTHADVHYNRGTVLLRLRRHRDALMCFERCLAVARDDIRAIVSQGAALEALGQLEAALACYDRARTLDPNQVEALNNSGNVLSKLHRFDEAMECFEGALKLSPGHADVNYNQSFVRLLRGDYARGWRQYEARWRTAGFAAQKRQFAAALWLGETQIAGKTILLHHEQGIGDTIQFARYAPLIARMGARVLLAVQPSLKSLVWQLPGVEDVYGPDDVLPPFERHCPLLSLPLALQTEVGTIPTGIPYVTADPARVSRWKEVLGGRAQPRVGLVWAGRADYANDAGRSIGLPALTPLLGTPGVTWVSLQHELRPEDRLVLEAHSGIARLGERFEDFADTAAAIAQLDLVISVDTAVAHLAGAMGKPVWILLPHYPDFRWFLGRDDSPWYPSARLFRQPARGDWQSVVARLRTELAGLTS
ncbi:MAG TPA: tetratricopeptide repeat protein [Xanthobacteraceae bacterium]|nr:tetratricopeptide repeat protein [Xanthobacteraceae bacterium]